MRKNSSPETPTAQVLAPAPRAIRTLGLLYTILRHGRGLSHEEASRRSMHASASPSATVG